VICKWRRWSPQEFRILDFYKKKKEKERKKERSGKLFKLTSGLDSLINHRRKKQRASSKPKAHTHKGKPGLPWIFETRQLGWLPLITIWREVDWAWMCAFSGNPIQISSSDLRGKVNLLGGIPPLPIIL